MVLERLSRRMTCPNHVSCQLSEEVPVDPHGSSAPSRWTCAQSRRYGEVSSCTWFRKPETLKKRKRKTQKGSCTHGLISVPSNDVTFPSTPLIGRHVAGTRRGRHFAISSAEECETGAELSALQTSKRPKRKENILISKMVEQGSDIGRK